MVYGYWPWGMHAPKNRKQNVAKKKALLVSSSAAPRLMGRLFYSSIKQLKITAKTMGADTVGSFFAGLVSDEPNYKLSKKEEAKAISLAEKLVTLIR